jgi:hypothetical protein
MNCCRMWKSLQVGVQPCLPCSEVRDSVFTTGSLSFGSGNQLSGVLNGPIDKNAHRYL